jgi:hypothetical protein
MNEELDLLNPPSTDFSMLDYDCAYIPGNKVRMNYKYVSNASKKFAPLNAIKIQKSLCKNLPLLLHI